jgi:MarR family transcriptional regulator for hemolysin
MNATPRNIDHSRFFDALTHANRRLRALFDARAKGLGLTLSRARALMRLAERDGVSQSALAETLGIEQPSLVGLIDGLEKKGFVERRVDPDDRRSRRVYLTPAGQKSAAEIVDFTMRLRAQVLKGVDPDDLAAAIRVLTRANANIERES